MPNRGRPGIKRASKTKGRARAPAPAAAGEAGVRRKLIAFEPEAWQALSLLARDRMQSFQELADEAFRDVLSKHGRPVGLKEALRESARMRPANDPRPARGKGGRKPPA
jgi:hypothetical protein